MAKKKKPTTQSKPPRQHVVFAGISSISIGIVLAIGLFIQLAGYPLVTIDKPDVLYNGVTARVIHEDKAEPPFIAQYPVTGNMAVDLSIREHIDNIVKPYLVARRGLGDKVKHEQLQIDYSIMFYNKQTLSVELHQQKERPEGIVDKSSQSLVYDMRSAKKLAVGDIIKNLPPLRDILYDHLRAHYASTLTSADLIHILDMQPSEFQKVVPYKDIIGLTFDPHAAKNTETPITIGISKSLLKGIIADKYMDASSDIADKQPDITDVVATMPSRDEPINPNGNRIALTFDDGPGADTPRLLDALKKYRAHATFFVIGNLVGGHSDILKRQITEGNEIGNHSWAHANLMALSPAEIEHQVQATQVAIQQATGGYTPRLIRPPYGAIDGRVTAHIGGLVPAMWSVDTLDWRDRDTGIILDRIMSGARNGGVILLHDIHPRSVDAAIAAIQRLRSEGWQLVTVSQLN